MLHLSFGTGAVMLNLAIVCNCLSSLFVIACCGTNLTILHVVDTDYVITQDKDLENMLPSVLNVALLKSSQVRIF